MSTIRVIAAPGRLVPIHKSVASAPGGRMLFIDDATEVDVPDVSYIRRRVNAGDLLLVVPAKSAAKPTTKPAPAPLPPPPTAKES